MQTQENVKALYNAGLPGVFRLNALLLECNKFSRLANVNGENPNYLRSWFTSIMALYREISPKLTTQEKNMIKEYFTKYNKIGKITKETRTKYGLKIILDKTAFNKHYLLNHEIETILRELADKKGLLIPNKIETDLNTIISDIG